MKTWGVAQDFLHSTVFKYNLKWPPSYFILMVLIKQYIKYGKYNKENKLTKIHKLPDWNTEEILLCKRRMCCNGAAGIRILWLPERLLLMLCNTWESGLIERTGFFFPPMLQKGSHIHIYLKSSRGGKNKST